MIDSTSPIGRAMVLAALSGSKIALGPAFLAASRRRSSASGWIAAALGEMALDKLGVFPPRYRPMLLVPHAVSGALVARESMKGSGADATAVAIAGAAVAAGVACAAPIVRMALSRGLGVPDPLLGLLEDYAAVSMGSRATGLTMDQVADSARTAIGQVGDRVMATASSK
ncbi:hypothetical protein [Tautonia plasticadhaerens]|uniref:DUF4126 domain-containing protein n=1 Tax=Tautonia plasticadhaerens TaxID=2527974 RepID=A0A518H7E5_9BACT|nr:hypothetical protein [Tautonia plasticadhaerens]QDV36686.1 hypothetical protein ElP_46150 [Tautonia plasticadhaerens]